jgi:NDP-sugar pyrophosphorylase family protein
MQAKSVALQAATEVQQLPGYEALREDIAKVVQERPHWFNVQDPQQLAAALRDAYEIAKARNPQKVQAGNDAVNQQRQAIADNAAGIESGTHSGSNQTPPDEDPGTAIRNAILKQASKMHI